MFSLKAVIKAGILAVALVGASASAKTLTIAIDQSGFADALADKHFNAKAKRYIEQQIKQLTEGDTVKLKSFGSLQAPENFKEAELAITRHNKKKVAAAIGFQISKLKTTAKAQSATNLLAFFGRNKFGCKNGGKVIAVTDGVEVSELVDPVKLIKGKSPLPSPHEFVRLKGCEVTFYGLGLKRTETEMLNLRRAWHAWFTQAGASFDVE